MTYVDDMRAGFGRMKMCHMISDTSEELHAMADRIGVARKWIQRAGTPREHYDICLSKRRLAVENGAKEITQRELVALLCKKRQIGKKSDTNLPRTELSETGTTLSERP